MESAGSWCSVCPPTAPRPTPSRRGLPSAAQRPSPAARPRAWRGAAPPQPRRSSLRPPPGKLLQDAGALSFLPSFLPPLFLPPARGEGRAPFVTPPSAFPLGAVQRGPAARLTSRLSTLTGERGSRIMDSSFLWRPSSIPAAGSSASAARGAADIFPAGCWLILRPA